MLQSEIYPKREPKPPSCGLAYSPQMSGKPTHSQRLPEHLGAKSPGELTPVSLMMSQQDPLIIPHSWGWTRSISLWAELGKTLTSDSPLSKLYLEALRTLASFIIPDTQCIFCQNGPFVLPLVLIPILPDFTPYLQPFSH